VIDKTRAGHFIFSAVLYNLNQCLLHHPFLLQNHVKDCKTRVPTTFLKHASRRALEHAKLLTLALRVVQKRGLSLASFYSYACTVAGTIHKLYTFHDDERVSKASKALFECSIDFLQHGQAVWCHYPRMVSEPRFLNPNEPLMTLSFRRML
jgi:hypothetical protein